MKHCDRCGQSIKESYQHNGQTYGKQCIKRVLNIPIEKDLPLWYSSNSIDYKTQKNNAEKINQKIKTELKQIELNVKNDSENLKKIAQIWELKSNWEKKFLNSVLDSSWCFYATNLLDGCKITPNRNEPYNKLIRKNLSKKQESTFKRITKINL